MFIENTIGHYRNEHETDILNYEDFYQYLWDLKGSCFSKIMSESQAEYLKRFGQEYDFETIPKQEIISCFYHLIDDLLWVRKPSEDIQQLYKPYTDYFSNPNHIFNIYTLNHDLIVEQLLRHNNIDYSDGFSKTTKILMDHNNEYRIPVFDNVFTKRINLVKLHGSIDTHRYDYREEKNHHKDYDYFKTLDFYNKQAAIDIDENGNIVQNWTLQIMPQFITGKNKQRLIQEDKMYKELYSHFGHNLSATDQLVIIGYSFQDEHINNVIISSLSATNEIVHINPYIDFPFKHHNMISINPNEDDVILNG